METNNLTKEEAREKLAKLIKQMIFDLNGKTFISLPIYDENLMEMESPEPLIATTLKEQIDLESRPYEIKQYSWRGLLKIAYDLEDKK